ncbi:helix-turn-helix domain-containing protein [Nocardiopsis aegyptia]|uniref:helix-turn-helix domain-containing protein n=1 Tax=Nocardiopsis aegyptia TaxID=220378 RepID=UPI0036725DB1
MVNINDENPTLSRLIRRYRARAGLTQRQLADFSTVSVRTIRDLEHGRARRPRGETVRLVADGLQLNERERAGLELTAGCQVVAAEPGDEALRAPLPPTPKEELLGRTRELDTLRELLSAGRERLIGITGVAGVGKTRLALEACAERARAGHRVLWSSVPGPRLPHAPAAVGDLVSVAVRALFSDTSAPEPPAPNGALDRLITLVGDRPATLVLDGTSATPPSARLLLLLLRECPSLCVVTTSTPPSGIPGEHVLPLKPLALPGASEGADPTDDTGGGADPGPAVRLFLRAARPWPAPGPDDADTVTAICRRLDGLPRSLELAAPWLEFYTPQALLRCLEEDLIGLLGQELHSSASSEVLSRLSACVRGLGAGERAVLEQLCRSRSGLSIERLAKLCGHTPVACGRTVRTLLRIGLVHTDGHARFRALHLVQALTARSGPVPTVDSAA